jgi:hypothetical protein
MRDDPPTVPQRPMSTARSRRFLAEVSRLTDLPVRDLQGDGRRELDELVANAQARQARTTPRPPAGDDDLPPVPRSVR